MSKPRMWVSSFEIFLCLAFFNMATINMSGISILPVIMSETKNTTNDLTIHLMLASLVGCRSLSFLMATITFCILDSYGVSISIFLAFFGMLTEMISCAFMAMGRTFPILLIARTIEGIGAGAITVSSIDLIFREFRNFTTRSWQMSLTALFRMVGNFTTPVIFGASYESMEISGQQLCFSVVASINLINIFVFYSFFNNRYNLPVEQVADNLTIVDGHESLSFSTLDSLQFTDGSSFSVRIMEKIGCIYFLNRTRSTLEIIPKKKFAEILIKPNFLISVMALFLSHLPYFVMHPTLILHLIRDLEFNITVSCFVWIPSLFFSLTGSFLGTLFFNRLSFLKWISFVTCILAAICNILLPLVSKLYLLMLITGYFSIQLALMKYILLPTISQLAEVKTKPLYRSLPIIYFQIIESACICSCILAGVIMYKFNYFILNVTCMVISLLLSPLFFLIDYYCVADFL